MRQDGAVRAVRRTGFLTVAAAEPASGSEMLEAAFRGILGAAPWSRLLAQPLRLVRRH